MNKRNVIDDLDSRDSLEKLRERIARAYFDNSDPEGFKEEACEALIVVGSHDFQREIFKSFIQQHMGPISDLVQTKFALGEWFRGQVLDQYGETIIQSTQNTHH